jgi:hypothetical protein
MSPPLHHLLAQGPSLRALGRVAISAVLPRGAPEALPVPGPWIEAELPPRPEALVADYIRECGGDPASYRGVLPAHLFPQWGFPLAARAVAGLPYPLARVVNAGCRIEIRAPLPAGEPLLVRARIEAIDDDGRRALITQRVVTGTRSAPDAVIADLRAHVPLRREAGKRSDKARPEVASYAARLATLRLGARAGFDFAVLTGDVNPIHWIPAYARAAGFRSTILHGFATLARAFEALVRARLEGDPTRLTMVDARFVKPLVLPADVAVFADADNHLWVGDAPGGDAYLEGRFETSSPREATS